MTMWFCPPLRPLFAHISVIQGPILLFEVSKPNSYRCLGTWMCFDGMNGASWSNAGTVLAWGVGPTP